MPDSLYENDALLWAERQSDLLRRLSRGEGVNEAIDWPNVIVEIHHVGLSQLAACKSLLRQAILHLLKIKGWPHGTVRHWSSEVSGFLADARDVHAPSMRQWIDMAKLYRDARDRVLLMEVDGALSAPLPEACPYALDDLPAKRPDIARLAGLG